MADGDFAPPVSTGRISRVLLPFVWHTRSTEQDMSQRNVHVPQTSSWVTADRMVTLGRRRRLVLAYSLPGSPAIVRWYLPTIFVQTIVRAAKEIPVCKLDQRAERPWIKSDLV